MSASSDVYWLACATAHPPNLFTQEEVFAMAGYDTLASDERRRAEAVFRSSGVERRALWLPRGPYRLSEDADDFHHRYVTGVREMAPRVARQALLSAGLEAESLDLVVFVSGTGFASPDFATELVGALGASTDCAAASLLGMGCSALIIGLERACERLKAQPGARALVVAVEVCSATYWVDREMETVVGNSLFADGAAAVVLTSRESDLRGPRGLHVGNRSFSHVARIEGFRRARDLRHAGDLGFTQQRGRLRVRLSRELAERLAPLVARVAAQLELGAGARVALHPAGRRALEAVAKELGRATRGGWEEPLRLARETLRDFGNMSSPTAAFVLHRSFEESSVRRGGEEGALIAAGSGLAAEAVRLRWLE